MGPKNFSGLIIYIGKLKFLQMTESEAQRRVKAVIQQRAQAEQQYQDDWEAADKPTTVNSAGVVRQLGAQPLESRQLLSNTTAGAGVPIAGSAVPGGIVGDWMPRFREEVPVVRRRRVEELAILFAVDSDSAFEVAEFTERTYWLYAGGQYFELGNVGTVDWRIAGDPEIPFPPVNGNVTSGLGTIDLDHSVISFEVTEAGEASARHIANAVKYDYSANVEATASLTGLTVAQSAADSFDEAIDISVRAVADVADASDSDSTSGSYVSFKDTQFTWKTGGNVIYRGSLTGASGTASGEISLSDIQVAYQEQWDPWLYVNGKQWIVWVFVNEELNATTTAEYQESRFYGWTGRKSSVSSTKVYGRRAYQDGSFTYAEATTDAELVYSSTPVTLSDFFENEKSWRLDWDGGSTSNPCESSHSGGTDNLVGTTLYRAILSLSTILSYANDEGGDVALRQYTATSNGSCTIELVGVTTKSIPGGQSFDVCEAASYYKK